MKTNKFSLDKHAYISETVALKAYRELRMFWSIGGSLVTLGAAALILFTPLVVWLPILCVVLGIPLLVWCIRYAGTNIPKLIKRYKRNLSYYREAKEYGVRDE